MRRRICWTRGGCVSGSRCSIRKRADTTCRPPTCRTAIPGETYLIADDMPKLRSRVEQLLGGLTWAENPRSRIRHMISNVKIDGMDGQILLVRANFTVYRMRFQNIDPYIGEYHYKLRRNGGVITIIERRVVLDLEALRPHGKVSFIV